MVVEQKVSAPLRDTFMPGTNLSGRGFGFEFVHLLVSSSSDNHPLASAGWIVAGLCDGR